MFITTELGLFYGRVDYAFTCRLCRTLMERRRSTIISMIPSGREGDPMDYRLNIMIYFSVID